MSHNSKIVVPYSKICNHLGPDMAFRFGQHCGSSIQILLEIFPCRVMQIRNRSLSLLIQGLSVQAPSRPDYMLQRSLRISICLRTKVAHSRTPKGGAIRRPRGPHLRSLTELLRQAVAKQLSSQPQTLLPASARRPAAETSVSQSPHTPPVSVARMTSSGAPRILSKRPDRICCGARFQLHVCSEDEIHVTWFRQNYKR